MGLIERGRGEKAGTKGGTNRDSEARKVFWVVAGAMDLVTVVDVEEGAASLEEEAGGEEEEPDLEEEDQGREKGIRVSTQATLPGDIFYV
jgi:hypothetical protein